MKIACELLERHVSEFCFAGAGQKFTLPIDPYITISQGVTLYKQFLHLLGALDEVYDKWRGYALVNPLPC